MTAVGAVAKALAGSQTEAPPHCGSVSSSGTWGLGDTGCETAQLTAVDTLWELERPPGIQRDSNYLPPGQRLGPGQWDPHGLVGSHSAPPCRKPRPETPRARAELGGSRALTIAQDGPAQAQSICGP